MNADEEGFGHLGQLSHDPRVSALIRGQLLLPHELASHPSLVITFVVLHYASRRIDGQTRQTSDRA